MMHGGRTKPESYCKIATYLEHNTQSLYHNIQDLCLFGIFNVRGNKGVTFLLPDADTRKKIDKLVGTNAHEAIAMIHACVIPEYIGSIQDFESQKEDIPNKLGNRLPIKNVSASTVTLDNGTTIIVDNKFRKMHDNNRFNIFLLKGNVPTEGEPSSRLGKTTGKYEGGNNSEFKNELFDDADLDYTWNSMFMKSKDQIKRRVKLRFGKNVVIGGAGRYSTIDPLSHGLVAIMSWLKYSNISGKKRRDDTKYIYAAVSETLPVSPLAYWFVAPLLNVAQTKDWSNHTTNYDKTLQFSEMYADGKGQNLANDDIKVKKSTSVNRSNIVSVVINTYAEAYKLLSADAKKGAVEHWGSAEKFQKWWIAMDEFCYLYSVQYTSSYESGCLAELRQIWHVYHNYVLPHATNGAHSNWNKTLHLTSVSIEDGLFYQERYCTLFTFYFSHMCCSVGGNLSTVSEYKSGVVYKWDEKPNSAQAWSFSDIMLGFWRNCSQLSAVN